MYYLDNDIFRYALTNQHGVAEYIGKLSPDEIALSSIIVEEMLKDQVDAINTARSMRKSTGVPHAHLVTLIEFMSLFQIVPYTDEAEELYSTFGKGTTNIGKYDARLVAHAKIAGAVIVTNNLSDFEAICEKENITDVVLETWARPS